MKLCSRLLIVFGQNICGKTTNVLYELHFGQVSDDARPWLTARWKAHAQLFYSC